MSAISSATSAVFTQVTATAPTRTDASAGSAQQVPEANKALSTQSPVSTIVSSTTRNGDGTYGPHHLRTKPGTIPSAQPQASGSVTSVNIQA